MNCEFYYLLRIANNTNYLKITIIFHDCIELQNVMQVPTS